MRRQTFNKKCVIWKKSMKETLIERKIIVCQQYASSEAFVAGSVSNV
jgi:hypothetical protein